MSKRDLEKIKEYSNKLCAEENLSIINTMKSQIKDISKNELAVAQKGESWKFKLMNDIDYCISISDTKEEFIKNMNTLNYQVTWSDNRKYITYTTKDGNKCRDKSLHDIKYLKESMENEFRRIKSEKSKYTTKSSSSINSENGILSSTARNIERTMQLEPNNKERNYSAKEERKRYTRKNIKRQYTNEQCNERNGRTSDTKRTFQLETNKRRRKAKDIQNQTKNRSNSILNRISYLNHFVSNPQIKNRPRRKIKGDNE